MDSYIRKDWEETGGEECPFCGSHDVRDLQFRCPVQGDKTLWRVPCACVACSEVWWLLLQTWAWEDMSQDERHIYWWKDPLDMGEKEEEDDERGVA